MDLIDPDPDPWTTSQIDLRPVLSVRSCLLIRGQYLTLVTITRPLRDLWINFMAWPQPGFITVRLPVPQAASLSGDLDSGLAPAAGSGPALLPPLWPAGRSPCSRLGSCPASLFTKLGSLSCGEQVACAAC